MRADDSDTSTGDSPPENHGAIGEPPSAIASELVGSLPCVVCRYELNGLSVLAVCPECGTPVRSTLQHVVDPEAHRFRDLRFPRTIAVGLIAWTSAGALVACLFWLLRLVGVATVLDDAIEPFYRTAQMFIGPGIIIAIAVSAMGALPLVVPQPGLAMWRSGLALIGVACSVGACYMVWSLVGFDTSHVVPYSDFMAIPDERTIIRIKLGLLLAAQLALLRGTARPLWRRSVQIRVGRIERQTLAGIIIAVLVGVAGDLLLLLASQGLDGLSASVARTAGVFLIALASLFTTVGLLSAAADALRHGPALVRKPLALRDVLGRSGGRDG